MSENDVCVCACEQTCEKILRLRRMHRDKQNYALPDLNLKVADQVTRIVIARLRFASSLQLLEKNSSFRRQKL